LSTIERDMPRANRYLLPGYACHLTHRCHDGEWLLRFSDARGEYRMARGFEKGTSVGS